MTDRTAKVLVAQGGYYLATGLLPFFSRRAFEAMTGPKREWWLVLTVGGVVTAVGGALVSAGLRREAQPELVAIAAGSAATLAGIDVVYVARGRIKPTYLVDAAIELALVAGLAAGARDQGSMRSR